jgi:hypothetical protein
MLERHPRQVPNNPQLEEQLDELINHTMDSLNCMEPTELTTVILFMAKIVNTLKEAKQRRKMNRNHHAFGKLLLDKDSGPMEDVFDFLAIAAERILPAYSARHISNLAYAYALIGYNPKLDNQTLLQNIGNESIGFIEGFNGQDISNMVWAFATLKTSKHLMNKLSPTLLGHTLWLMWMRQRYSMALSQTHCSKEFMRSLLMEDTSFISGIFGKLKSFLMLVFPKTQESSATKHLPPWMQLFLVFKRMLYTS